MNEEKPKRGLSGTLDSNRTAAYILIGLGVLFLLANVLNINWGRLWPLLLVAVGLFLLFGRNVFSYTTKVGNFSAPLAGAKSALVNLNLSVGEATVNASAPPDKLLDAELHYVGEVELAVSGEDERVVTLRQTSESGLQWINPGNWFASMDGLPWKISLNRDVATDLKIHGGAGRIEVDVRNLKLTGLDLQGGVGQINVKLPSSAAGYDVRINGGVGETRVELGADTATRLYVRGGVGQVIIETPSDAGVRLHSTGGLGSVSVPSRFVRTAGGDGDFDFNKSGSWETDNFASSAHKIEIDYEGGVGQLRVK
jgi:predicted membrane protein